MPRARVRARVFLVPSFSINKANGSKLLKWLGKSAQNSSVTGAQAAGFPRCQSCWVGFGLQVAVWPGNGLALLVALLSGGGGVGVVSLAVRGRHVTSQSLQRIPRTCNEFLEPVTNSQNL
jgi:hypothetical protein